MRRATIRFVMSVRPSIRPHGITRLPLDGTIWNLTFFRNSVLKIQFSLNLTRMTGTLRENVFIFMTISRWIFHRMRNFSDKWCRENKNTHFVFHKFLRKTFLLWDKEKSGGATNDDTIWRMRVACWISEATRAHAHALPHAPRHPHTHARARALARKCVIITSFPRQQGFRESAPLLRSRFTVCLI